MITVKNLDFSYNNKRQILSQVAFDAGAGQCIAILGNNGAGKSTLMKCLNQILQPQKGVVQVNGEDVRKFRRNEIAQRMAYLTQHHTGARLTVFDSVLLGRKPYIRLEPKAEDIDITAAVIRRMGLEEFTLHYVDELSGGEMQKVMLARALAQQPKVLLLDEPTSSLDLRNQYAVLGHVREIAKQESISVIIVIHDLNLALRYCDKFLLVKDSRVFAYGGKEVMVPENISQVYDIPVAVETIRGIPMVVALPEK